MNESESGVIEFQRRGGDQSPVATEATEAPASGAPSETAATELLTAAVTEAPGEPQAPQANKRRRRRRRKKPRNGHALPADTALESANAGPNATLGATGANAPTTSSRSLNAATASANDDSAPSPEPAEPSDVDGGADADAAAPSARERARLERVQMLLQELGQPLPQAASATAAEIAGAQPAAAAFASSPEQVSAPEVASMPKTAVPETAVPETAVPEAAVPETAVPEAAVSEAAVSETAVPEAAVSETAAPAIERDITIHPERALLRATETALVEFVRSKLTDPAAERDALAQRALEAAPLVALLELRLLAMKDVAQPSGAELLFELVRRLESRDVDPEQLLRVLSLVSDIVTRDEWLDWILALTENRDTRRTLEAMAGRLPEPWRTLHGHARVLFQVVVRGQTNQAGAPRLARALKAALSSGARSFETRPVAVRQRLVGLALGMRPTRAISSALERHLAALRNESAAFELDLELVRGHLAQGQHDLARAKLEPLAAAQGDHAAVSAWRRALGSACYGDIALLKSRVKPPLECAHPLRPGYSLVEQRDVWLRVGATTDAPGFIAHVEAHRRAEVPGIAAICEAGFTPARRPYVAYERIGDNARHALFPPRGLERGRALSYAKQLTRLALVLGRTGLTLPDADLGRLELSTDDRLWLVETWGAQIESAETAMEKALGTLRQWQITLLGDSPNFELPKDARDNLEHAADFRTVHATLDGLLRSHYWAT